MGCCLIKNETPDDLKKYTTHALKHNVNLSSPTTNIYTNKQIVWKVCSGNKKSLSLTQTNNERIKNLPASIFIAQPRQIIRMSPSKLAVSMRNFSPDLFTFMKTPFSTKKVFRGLEDIAQGIAWMHSHNLAHRDIKPENIVIGKHYKLIDFDFTSPLENYYRCGTEHYLVSQEIVNTWECDDIERSKRTDVFAFGKTIFAVLWFASSRRIISYNKVLKQCYFGNYCNPSCENPFKGEAAHWFSIGVQCCLIQPPSCIPLTTNPDAIVTVSSFTIGADLEMVNADETFA